MLLVTAVLGAAVGTSIAGFAQQMNRPQQMTSSGVGVPFLHGFFTAKSPGKAELASLEKASEWLNSPPLTEIALRGKVVLIDFWTYTCINWRRTDVEVYAFTFG